MEEIVNSVISELETFEATVLAPFFQNKDTMIGIMIAIAAIGLFYNVPSNVKKLFESATFRLIWILLIVLATLYDPVIGLLTALCYIMFMKPSKESFISSQDGDCFSNNAPVNNEEHSFAQEQLEIVESNEETTHLQRVLEGSTQAMQQSID
jgi:hypothetical protein